MVGVRIDRKRKQSVTVFLKALGWSSAQILEQFGEFESIKLTLEKDNVETQDEALLDIYRKLRPGEPPTKEGKHLVGVVHKFLSNSENLNQLS